ncbi:hypothetical protein ACFL43_03865 [Thermodesulfobacteriota bacterium]
MKGNTYYDPTEAYWHNYHSARYGLKKEGYTVREIPILPYSLRPAKAYISSNSIANGFIDDVVKDCKEFDPDDIFKSKTGVAKDRISLFLDVIGQLEGNNYNSLQGIYRDIFDLQKKQTEMPFPLNYDFGSTLKIKEDRLRLYQEARQLMSQHSKNLTTIGRDLVDSLITFKNQKQKEALIGDDDLIENNDPKY